jgi:hypothetical protein
MSAVVHCLGYAPAALPEIIGFDVGGTTAVSGCNPTTGSLCDGGGAALPGLYGAGIAFAADEMSSGAPYPEASLKAFSARASAILSDLCAQSAYGAPSVAQQSA